MKKISILLFSGIVLILSCNNPSQDTKVADSSSIKTVNEPVKEKVLSKEEQMALTPDQIIQSLKDGNQRFINKKLITRNTDSLVKDAVAGQYPKAVILACMDSRVPVEKVFDKSIGDLFVCRVAGNIVNDDMLASMEYGCKVSGAKVIVVLGHKYCGAIQSAIKDVKLGNITQLLQKIKPAITMSNSFTGEQSYKNEDYVLDVSNNNVKHNRDLILEKSPILKEMVSKGELKIVGAGYNLNTGEVIFQ